MTIPARDNHPDPNQWWFHRRIMAYVSLFGLCCVLVAVFAVNVAEHKITLLQTLAWVFSANLLYYYGGNAVEALKVKR